MLLDSVMMSPIVIDSTGCTWESRIVNGPTCIDAGTRNRSSSETAPVSSAAAAVMILFTDPGSKESVTARLRIASRGASL